MTTILASGESGEMHRGQEFQELIQACADAGISSSDFDKVCADLGHEVEVKAEVQKQLLDFKKLIIRLIEAEYFPENIHIDCFLIRGRFLLEKWLLDEIHYEQERCPNDPPEVVRERIVGFVTKKILLAHQELQKYPTVGYDLRCSFDANYGEER